MPRLAARGAVFERQHLGDQAAIVVEGINPGEAGSEHGALNPRSIACRQMSEDAAMTVLAGAPEMQRERRVADQLYQMRARLGGERPGRIVRPAERQLRPLQADEADLAQSVEPHRVGIDHFDDAMRLAAREARGKRHGLGHCGNRRHHWNHQKQGGKKPSRGHRALHGDSLTEAGEWRERLVTPHRSLAFPVLRPPSVRL